MEFKTNYYYLPVEVASLVINNDTSIKHTNPKLYDATMEFMRMLQNWKGLQHCHFDVKYEGYASLENPLYLDANALGFDFPGDCARFYWHYVASD